MPLVEEARAIGRAAADVGIRIAFAIAVRDQNPVVYGDAEPVLSALRPADRSTIEQLFVRAPMSPQDYIALTDEIAAAIAGPMIDIQFGPAGVQWCSRPLLEAVAANSAQTGRRIHMHLLETVYQRAWADQNYPQGIVRYLRDIGFLSERLTLAHCIHARPDELEMIAASGARIVTNFSSNMHLRSGLAPIAAAHGCGCRIAVGVDGLALDEDDDALREMRLVQMMHGGLGFKRTWTPAEFFALAVRNGRAATGAPGEGELKPGAPADFVVIDLDRLDRDRILAVDPIELLFARGNSSVVRDVVVGGQTVVQDGRCITVDLDAIEHELRAMYRVSAGKLASFQRVWPALSAGLQQWFEANMHCG
jgi:cytosine/adenosine deaminase-related metal-dependent hydrolase